MRYVPGFKIAKLYPTKQSGYFEREKVSPSFPYTHFGMVFRVVFNATISDGTQCKLLWLSKLILWLICEH